MAENIVMLIISNTEPSDTSASEGWLWIDTVNKVAKRYSGFPPNGTWVEKPLVIDIPVTVGELTITSKLFSGDKKGITETITLAEGVLKFKDGILHKWTPT